MRWLTLRRIVRWLPNFRCRRRCILFLHPTAGLERRDEQFVGYDDDVTLAGRESLIRIGFADGGVVRAVAGEPFGETPERLAFDAAADDEVLPARGVGGIGGEEGGGDLPLQLRPEDRERHTDGTIGGAVV